MISLIFFKKEHFSAFISKIRKIKIILVLTFFIFHFSFFISLAQDDSNFLQTISDSILSEGVSIYESAVASKTSADFVIDKLSVEEIFGYITYKKNNSTHTIFLKGNQKTPEVRYTFSFPAPFNSENRNLDGVPRALSDYEISLNKMRQKIFKMAKKRKSFFANYSGIVLNPVYFQRGNLTYVYLISSTNDDSFIPLGNDYLLVFNEKIKLVSKEKIHQNLIEIPVGNSDTLKSDEALSSFHTHSEFSSPFITSTDICTLLLNAKNEKMESHIVVSEEYVSFFFTHAKQLEIITREEYEKMSVDEEK